VSRYLSGPSEINDTREHRIDLIECYDVAVVVADTVKVECSYGDLSAVRRSRRQVIRELFGQGLARVS